MHIYKIIKFYRKTHEGGTPSWNRIHKLSIGLKKELNVSIRCLQIYIYKINSLVKARPLANHTLPLIKTYTYVTIH